MLRMTEEQQRNIFRMAAIIYGQSSQKASLTKSHQRIIDDALYTCGKSPITVTELILYINREYGLLYSVDEIQDIVIKGRNADQKYYYYIDNNNDVNLSLTAEYKNKCSIVCGYKTLYDYIDDYLKLYNIDEDYRDLILRFFYEMFTSNLEGYKLILHEKIETLKKEDTSYTEKEKEIINNFLKWPDDGKDKAVYDLAGYSLEYCMMTNHKNTLLDTNNLKRKSFYIDTNIIYRALGLNSENLKIRVHLFLSKFKEVGEYLVISQNTRLEFIDTINYYVGKIANSLRPKVNSKVISEFISEDSVFHCYHKWCIGRVNRNPEYFKTWIMSEFDSLCKKYEIRIEVKCPYNIEDKRDNINEYVSSILQLDTEKQRTSAEYDALNILWIEEKRKFCSDDIYQVKDFLLSSDNKLRQWDYLRTTNRVPIVMSPNQWLNIILNYVQRTSDDYKSFVSFLTLTVRTESLSIDMLSTIISGIAEATSDLGEQQNLVRNFIETNTFDDIEKMSESDLYYSAQEFATTKLEKRILELESSQQNYVNELAEIRDFLNKVTKKSENEQKKIERQLSEEKHAKDAANKDVVNMRQELLKIWKRKKIILWTIILLCSVVCGLLVFMWKDKSWNFMADIVNCIDTSDKLSTKIYGEVIIGLPLMLIGYALKMIKDAIDVDEYNKQNLRIWWRTKKS